MRLMLIENKKKQSLEIRIPMQSLGTKKEAVELQEPTKKMPKCEIIFGVYAYLSESLLHTTGLISLLLAADNLIKLLSILEAVKHFPESVGKVLPIVKTKNGVF